MIEPRHVLIALLLLLVMPVADAADYSRETRPADVLQAVTALSSKVDLLTTGLLTSQLRQLEERTATTLIKLDDRLRSVEDDRNLWRGALLVLAALFGGIQWRLSAQLKDAVKKVD